MSILRSFAVAAPLAFALAACNSAGTEGEGEVPQSAPIAEIAAPVGTEWRDTTTVSPDGGYILGNPDAPIKLVEYGSLTCPACASFAANGIPPLEEEYVNSGRVSYEFRSVLIHGAPDVVLTRLATCGPKEAVHPLASQIWGNLNPILDGIQANPAALEQAMALPEDQRFVAFAQTAGLFDFFASRGLSQDQATQCLADFASIEALAKKTAEVAERDGVTRTPTFLVNGRTVEASQWDGIEPILQRAGAR